MSSRSERRTVHPVITQAIVDGLDRADLQSPSVNAARAALGAGHHVDERIHRSLKQFLFTQGGPQASFDTGRQFAVSTEHPLLALLARSRSPSELIHRARRLEPLLHLGNRTRIVVTDTELGVLHAGNRGINPTTGESLFVCGAQCGMLERIGAAGIEISITDEHGNNATSGPPADTPVCQGGSLRSHTTRGRFAGRALPRSHRCEHPECSPKTYVHVSPINPNNPGR